MATGLGRRALPLLYLIPVSAAACLLALVGYAIDRLPFVPASVPRGYQRVMFAAIFGLSRPVDGLLDRGSEPVPERVAGESAP